LTAASWICYLPSPVFTIGHRKSTPSLSFLEHPLALQPSHFRKICLIAGITLLVASDGWAQRIRFPAANPYGTAPQLGTTTGDASLVPVPQLGAPNYGGGSGVSLGGPGFDPYATAPNAASTPPSLLGVPNTPYGGSATPNWNVPFWNAPISPPVAPTFPVYPSPSVIAPNGTYPGSLVPQQPPVLFPNGFNWQGQGQGGVSLPAGEYLRLFQDTRLIHTWLAGKNSPMEMQSHDAELATTLNLPNFFWSNRPLHVSPTFITHFWDGPDTDGTEFPTSLPARAYSGFLNLRWQPMLTPAFGADIDFNFGVFTDFDTLVSDSWRFFGTGIFVAALTPTVSLKGGINYLDRYDTKIFPAFGILWVPNPQTRFDIFFPRPKLAQYLTTLGNTDVWWYVNGEYGGGSWTIDRGADSASFRRVDINDIRVGAGLEWTCQSGMRGFVETAYVFDRKIIFADGPIAERSLRDTIMLRGGLAF
jgi:hypothetical protein